MLGNELTAINQYFLHARMYKDWGIDALGKKEYLKSIDEMNHADQLSERILFLDGQPNVQKLGKLKIGENTKDILQCDLDLEMEANSDLREAINYAECNQDFVSRDLFQLILEDEQKHIDWLENQLGLVGEIGIESYIQSQMTPN